MTHNAMVPILQWTLSDVVNISTITLVKSLVPGWQETATWALTNSVHYSLNSQWVKDAAKESVKDMLLSRLSAAAAATHDDELDEEEEHPKGLESEVPVDSRGLGGDDNEEEDEEYYDDDDDDDSVDGEEGE